MPTPGVRAWRTQMHAEDFERCDPLAGHLLDELGYPRAFSQPGYEARRQAVGIRELLDGEAGAIAGPRTD